MKSQEFPLIYQLLKINFEIQVEVGNYGKNGIRERESMTDEDKNKIIVGESDGDLI